MARVPLTWAVFVEDSFMMDDSQLPFNDTSAYELITLWTDETAAADLLMADKPDETSMVVESVKVEAATVEAEITPLAAKKQRKVEPWLRC